MFDFKYPYTDFHELNLDWMLKKFAEIEKIKGPYKHKIHITGYMRIEGGLVGDIDAYFDYINTVETPYTSLIDIDSALHVLAYGTITTQNNKWLIYGFTNKDGTSYVKTIGAAENTIYPGEWELNASNTVERYFMSDTVIPLTVAP